MAVTSTGETVLLATLLGVVAADLVAGAVAMVAGLALAVRWGATSLDAVAGAQAVLGPGGTVGSLFALGATWCAAAALVLVSPRGWPALAFGAAASLGVAGPALGAPGDLVVRTGGLAIGVAVAATAARRLPSRLTRALAMGLAGVALVLAVAS